MSFDPDLIPAGYAWEPPPERLSDDECAYHCVVVVEVQQAKDALALATYVGERWWAHLRERHALTEADTVTADGRIERAAPDPESEG